MTRGGRRKDPGWHETNTSYRIRGPLRGQDPALSVRRQRSRAARLLREHRDAAARVDPADPPRLLLREQDAAVSSGDQAVGVVVSGDVQNTLRELANLADGQQVVVPAERVAIGYSRRVPGHEGRLMANLFTRGASGSAAGGGFSTTGDLLTFVNAAAGRMSAEAFAGGSPGSSTLVEARGPWTAIVLTNLDPPAASVGVAVLGVTAYRAAFGQPKAVLGRQPELLDAFEWYCPKCHALLHRAEMHVADLGRQLPVAFDAFHADLERRACKRCGTLHPGK